MTYEEEERLELEREMEQQRSEFERAEADQTLVDYAIEHDQIIMCHDCEGTGIQKYSSRSEMHTVVNPYFPYCMECGGAGELLYSEYLIHILEQRDEDDRREAYYDSLY